jgi:hypothetical protein
VPVVAFLELTAILVEDYDDAIAFFTHALEIRGGRGLTSPHQRRPS